MRKPSWIFDTRGIIDKEGAILAGFKVPSEFQFIEIPKTSTGKIQKFKLRELIK